MVSEVWIMPYKKITCPTCKGKKTEQGVFGKEHDCATCAGLGYILRPLECGFKQLITSNGTVDIYTNPKCVEDNCIFWDTEKLDCNFNIIKTLLSGQTYDQIPPKPGT
jgi:hypothetical protein